MQRNLNNNDNSSANKMPGLNKEVAIRKMTKSDILLGRGNGIGSLPGNITFRGIIKSFRSHYVEAKRSSKLDIARQVVEKVKQLDPPGRFLELCDVKNESIRENTKNSGTMDGQRDFYLEVNPKRVIEKVCQALRERPKKRLKTISQKNFSCHNEQQQHYNHCNAEKYLLLSKHSDDVSSREQECVNKTSHDVDIHNDIVHSGNRNTLRTSEDATELTLSNYANIMNNANGTGGGVTIHPGQPSVNTPWEEEERQTISIDDLAILSAPLLSRPVSPVFGGDIIGMDSDAVFMGMTNKAGTFAKNNNGIEPTNYLKSCCELQQGQIRSVSYGDNFSSCQCSSSSSASKSGSFDIHYTTSLSSINYPYDCPAEKGLVNKMGVSLYYEERKEQHPPTSLYDCFSRGVDHGFLLSQLHE